MAARKKSAKKKAGRKKAAAKKNNVTSLVTHNRGLPKAMEAHKWKPGQSGNPAGRPKQQSLEVVLRAYLQGTIGEGEGEITRFEAMVKVIFSEAVTKRNAKILIAIMDRLYPKPIILKGDPEAPIQIERPDLSALSTKDLKAISAMRKKILAIGE